MSNTERAGSIQFEQIPNPTQYRLSFGRYKGYTLREIYRTDPIYVRRLAREHPEIPSIAEGLQLLETEPVRSGQAGLMPTVLFLLLLAIIIVVIVVSVM
jgi:hypothetical protein